MDGADVVGSWVRRLDHPVGGPEPASFPDSLSTAARLLGDGPVRWAVQVAHDMATRTLAEVPALAAPAAALDLIRLVAEPALLRTLAGIHDGGLAPEGIPPEVTAQLRDYVRLDVPLEQVWEAIRRGHECMATQLVAACRELVEPAELAEQLELVSRVLFAYVNPLSTAVGEVYADERRRFTERDGRVRDELVHALLAGGPADLDAAAVTLRYPIGRRFHLGVVLVRDSRDPRTAPDLAHLAGTLLAASGATATVSLPVGPAELWAWGGSARPFPARIDAAVLTSAADLSGVRVGVGAAGPGLAGFRTTHAQARRAEHTGRLLGHRLTPFDDVNLLAMLIENLDEARAFVRHELRDLAVPGRHVTDLQDTLLAYLEHRRSPQSAAAELFVARNTVTYRVQRAEALLGHRLDERETEVRVALRLARALRTVDRP